MAPTIAPKISPTLRTGMGSTAGAKDGSPAADSGPVAAKRQKMVGGKIPRVSSNLDGARRRMKSLRPATAKAAGDEKGPEVIPSDDDDKQGDEATLTRPTKPLKGGRTMPVGKTSYAGRTAPGKAPSHASERHPTKLGRSRGRECPQRCTSQRTTTTSTSTSPRPSNVALPWRRHSATTASLAARRPPARFRLPVNGAREGRPKCTRTF